MTFRSPKEHHKCASVQKICQSKGNGPFYKNCFIDLLTTVHFFSVLTAFATYFGVIQRDSERIQRIFFFLILLWELPTGSGAQCTNQNDSLLSSRQHGRHFDLLAWLLFFFFLVDVLSSHALHPPAVMETKHIPGKLIRYKKGGQNESNSADWTVWV